MIPCTSCGWWKREPGDLPSTLPACECRRHTQEERLIAEAEKYYFNRDIEGLKSFVRRILKEPKP